MSKLIKSNPALDIIQGAGTPTETTEKKAVNEIIRGKSRSDTATPKKAKEKRDRKLLVLLTPSLYEGVEEIAQDKDLSVNQVIFTALKEYVDREAK